MITGAIYKNRRHHPDRIFVVTKVRAVKIGKAKLHRIHGILIVQDGGLNEGESYLSDTFAREFPFVMFAP